MLARKYFRFFNCIDCFGRVYALLGQGAHAPGTGAVTRNVDLVRFTCLGMYFFLENLTIVSILLLLLLLLSSLF